MSDTKKSAITNRVERRRHGLHRSSGTLFVEPPRKIEKKKPKKKPKKPAKKPAKKKKPPSFEEILKKIQEEGEALGIDNKSGMSGNRLKKLKF